MNPMDCPCCNSANEPEAAFLGHLGFLAWFRCIFCGIEFSAEWEEV